jgi:hypothetical protein
MNTFLSSFILRSFSCEDTIGINKANITGLVVWYVNRITEAVFRDEAKLIILTILWEGTVHEIPLRNGSYVCSGPVKRHRNKKSGYQKLSYQQLRYIFGFFVNN